MLLASSAMQGSSRMTGTENAVVADQSRLTFTEGVAASRGIFRDQVAAELIGKVGHIMDINLRLDEKRRLDVELDAHRAVYLEVIGVQSRRDAEGASDAGHRNGLGFVKRNPGAADAALYDGHDALAGDGFVNGIEIVKPGTILQSRGGEVVCLGKAEGVFAVDAKVRPEHEVDAKYAKNAADGRAGLAIAREGVKKISPRASHNGARHGIHCIDTRSRGVSG